MVQFSLNTSPNGPTERTLIADDSATFWFQGYAVVH